MSLLEQLQEIHEKMKDPRMWHSCGICSMVELYSRDALSEIFQRWPKFSGAHEYPIPGSFPVNREASKAYDSARSAYNWGTPEKMWNRDGSSYASLRWELLEFCIAELERELQDEKA